MVEWFKKWKIPPLLQQGVYKRPGVFRGKEV